jgi:hypothetical protein
MWMSFTGPTGSDTPQAMKSKELAELLLTEPDADVRVQTQLYAPWCEIQSHGMGQKAAGEDGESDRYVLLRTYDLEVSMANQAARDAVPESIKPEGGIPLSHIHETGIKALDALGLALANHGHQWSDDERALYDEALRLLKL